MVVFARRKALLAEAGLEKVAGTRWEDNWLTAQGLGRRSQLVPR
jgi:hypothetical protein